MLSFGVRWTDVTTAHFTIEVDLPEGVTHEDFRRWAEYELRCAVGGTHPDEPIHDLEREKIHVMTAAFKRRPTAPPDRFAIHRPQNFVVAEEVQSKSRLHRQGEKPVKVFRTSLVPEIDIDEIMDKSPEIAKGVIASLLRDKRYKK
jgi:hypothetical protein